MHIPQHADLLIGTETGDDALVWRRPDGRALVATVDFFTPVVDDARTWGRIAAANAVSDVYAMGGSPLFALNLVAWPRERLSLDLLGEVLAGGQEVAEAGGWVVAGGHTIDGPEPMYGQAVVGEVDPVELLTNAGLRVGDALILTKPIGTGLVATALKRSAPQTILDGGWLAESYQAAVSGMVTLNAAAAQIARAHRASAATDVTGFGLLGHLHKMASASEVSVTVDVGGVPVIPGAWSLLDDGFVPGGTLRNREFVEPWIEGGHDERDLTMLCDAQTSGGLLFSVTRSEVSEVLIGLQSAGLRGAMIGGVEAGRPGSVRLEG